MHALVHASCLNGWILAIIWSILNQKLIYHCRDEDMQSLASLMSVKPTDIGNLDDFNESDEEEDKRSSTGINNPNTAVPGTV